MVHTHPNRCNARPSAHDRALGDRFQVAILTLTNRGMFMYDPATKKITLIKDGLKWLHTRNCDSRQVAVAAL